MCLSVVSCSAFLLCVARGELRCLMYFCPLGIVYIHPKSIKQGQEFGQLGMWRGTHFFKRRCLKRRINLLFQRSAFEHRVLSGFLLTTLAWQSLSRRSLFLLSFLLGAECRCPFAAYQDSSSYWPRGTEQWESCCVEQSINSRLREWGAESWQRHGRTLVSDKVLPPEAVAVGQRGPFVLSQHTEFMGVLQHCWK